MIALPHPDATVRRRKSRILGTNTAYDLVFGAQIEIHFITLRCVKYRYWYSFTDYSGPSPLLRSEKILRKRDRVHNTRSHEP